MIDQDASSPHGVSHAGSIEVPPLVPHTIWLDGMAASASHIGARGHIYEAVPRLTEPIATDAHVLTLFVAGRTTLCRALGPSEERLEVGPGDITLQPPSISTRWSWSDQIKVLHLAIEPSYLRAVVRAVTGGEPGILRMRDGLRISDDALFEMGIDIARELRPPRALGAESSASAIGERVVIHLLRNYFQRTATNEPGGGRFSGGQMAALRNSISSRLGDELRLEHLSEVVGLGVHHFCRVFRRTFGQSPHRFIRERRLERARDLLLGSSDPVGMIALRTGFSDQSHLTRCFKHHFGTPPAELRKRSAGRACQRRASPCEPASLPSSSSC